MADQFNEKKSKALISKEEIKDVQIIKEQDKLIFRKNASQIEMHLNEKIRVDISDKGLMFYYTQQDYEKALNFQKKLLRSLIKTNHKIAAHKIKGIQIPYKAVMKMFGTGYKAELKENNLILTIGFSNPKLVPLPQNVKVAAMKGKDIFVLESSDKQELNNFCNYLKYIKRRLDMYKGTGIFVDGKRPKLKEINKK